MNSKNTNIIESNNNNIANNTTTSIANNVNTNKQNDEVANLLRSPPLMLRKQNNVQENKTPPSSPFLIGKKSSLDNIKGRNSPRLKPIVNPNNINNINSITTNTTINKNALKTPPPSILIGPCIQSTGHTSTHPVSQVLIHFFPIIKLILFL